MLLRPRVQIYFIAAYRLLAHEDRLRAVGFGFVVIDAELVLRLPDDAVMVGLLRRGLKLWLASVFVVLISCSCLSARFEQSFLIVLVCVLQTYRFERFALKRSSV